MFHSRSQWIQASCPQQGDNTNDCGPWSCVFGAVYLMHHKASCCDYKQVSIECMNIPVSAKLDPKTDNATALGHLARKHMISCYNNGFLKDHSMLDYLKITFS